MIGLNHYLLLSGVLFCLGVLGVILRRNVLIILMSVELMLNAANIAIAAFSRYPLFNAGTLTQEDYLTAGNGLVFVFLILTVSAAEVGVGLAVVINLYRQRSTVNIEEVNLLQG